MRRILVQIDQIDARMLALLQKNNRLTFDEIGNSVGLSPTAVQRRLKKLRENGIIESDVSIVSPKAVGRPIAMVVAVTLERERADIVDRFKQAIRSAPQIMSGYYVTGEADFVLVITAKDMDDYDNFTRRFFYDNPDIKAFKTSVVIDRIKAGFEIPID